MVNLAQVYRSYRENDSAKGEPVLTEEHHRAGPEVNYVALMRCDVRAWLELSLNPFNL
jgi:hypothetical protein